MPRSRLSSRPGCAAAPRDCDAHLDSGQIEVVRWLSEIKSQGSVLQGGESKSSVHGVMLPVSPVEMAPRHRVALMQERLKLGLGSSEDLLLFDTIDGNRIRSQNFTKEFCRLAKKAGLAGISPHAGRYGHLTQLLELEAHPDIAQARAGHASMAVTMDIYSHVTDPMQDRAGKRSNAELEAALGGKV